MSHQFYSELWIAARRDVEKLLEMERNFRETKGVISKNKNSGQSIAMYIRYRELIRRLALCHDQICQSQKRELIKQVLNCTIGRMLELKRQLVLARCTESTYADDILTTMKLTPDDIEWRKPSYFVTDRQSYLRDRKKYINDLIELRLETELERSSQRMSTAMTTQTESDADFSWGISARLSTRPTAAEVNPDLIVPMRKETPEETAARVARERLKAAVLLIQIHDRARKSRILGTQLKLTSDYKKKIASGELEAVKDDKCKKLKAVIAIQKWWRSYATLLNLRKRVHRLEAVIGMCISSWKPHAIFDVDGENFRQKQLMQPINEVAASNAIAAENARVHRIRGPGLMEDMTDEIREWFLLWYNELGFFDTFPLIQAGGSILIATGQARTPEEYHLEQTQKAAKTKRSEEMRRGKGEKGGGKLKPKGSGDEDEPKILACLEHGNNDFLVNWSIRDESGNPGQREYVDLITDKLCYELQLEMREIVDELMRLELTTLETALAKDNAAGGSSAEGQSRKKQNNGEKKRRNKKKSKKIRGKTKNKKDLTSGSTIDDLFSELVTTGIIHEYPDVRITDWKGDVSYQNVKAREELRDVKRCLGDVIQPIMEYCILPIGSKEIHQIAPLIRSVCIIGLPRSGKSLLVNAICSEVGALVFDLSPEILAENYNTKKDLHRLVNIINRVARAYSPSLFFVDGGHRPWCKKISPQERNYNAKHLATSLTKLVKGIRPGDQILFLTTSDQPYKAGKKFAKIHEKLILIPLPDYNTLFILYKQLLMQYHGVERNFDCSALAEISSGFSVQSICEAIDNVLSINRRITLKKNPLKPREIIDYLNSNQASATVIARNEYEKILKWEKKTPLGKRRTKMEMEEKRAGLATVNNAGSKGTRRRK